MSLLVGTLESPHTQKKLGAMGFACGEILEKLFYRQILHVFLWWVYFEGRVFSFSGFGSYGKNTATANWRVQWSLLLPKKSWVLWALLVVKFLKN